MIEKLTPFAVDLFEHEPLFRDLNSIFLFRTQLRLCTLRLRSGLTSKRKMAQELVTLPQRLTLHLEIQLQESALKTARQGLIAAIVR